MLDQVSPSLLSTLASDPSVHLIKVNSVPGGDGIQINIGN